MGYDVGYEVGSLLLLGSARSSSSIDRSPPSSSPPPLALVALAIDEAALPSLDDVVGS